METNITPFDLQRMFIGDTPSLYLLEIGFRVVLIYLYAIIFMRFMGKRGQTELTPLELIIIIGLGSAAGDPMFYPEVPLIYAFVIISLMVGVDILLTKLKEKFELLERYIDSDPKIVIQNGVIRTDTLSKEKYSKRELFAKIRNHGVRYLDEIELAILEPTGEVSVYQKNKYAKNKDLTDLQNVTKY